MLSARQFRFQFLKQQHSMMLLALVCACVLILRSADAAAPAQSEQAADVTGQSFRVPDEKMQELLRQQRYLERQIAVRQKNANERKDGSAQQYNLGYDDGYNKALLDLLKSQLLNGIQLPNTAAAPASAGSFTPPPLPAGSQMIRNPDPATSGVAPSASGNTSMPANMSPAVRQSSVTPVTPLPTVSAPSAPTQSPLATPTPTPTPTLMTTPTPSILPTAPAAAAAAGAAALVSGAAASSAPTSAKPNVFAGKSIPLAHEPEPALVPPSANAGMNAAGNPTIAATTAKPKNEFDEYMSMSTQALQNKQWRQAADYASRAISIRNDVASAYINRSWALAELGDTRQALVDANLSIQIAPNMGLAYNNRAYTYELMDNLVEARKDYQRACQYDFQVACSVLPKVDAALAQRTMAKKDQVKELAKQNEELIRVHNWTQVIDVSTKIINIDANNTSAYINRAWARAENGQLEASLTDAGKAIIISPNDPIAYNNRAYTYELMNDIKSARRDYAKACELKLASACNVVQKIDELQKTAAPSAVATPAPAATVAVAKSAPAPSKNDQIQQLISASFEKFRQGNWSAVEQLSNQIIKLDSNNALAYVNRAGARTEMGLVYKALDDIETAIRLNPKLGIAYNNKGYTLERMGDLQKAAIQYQKACQLGLQQSCKDFKRLTKPR